MDPEQEELGMVAVVVGAIVLGMILAATAGLVLAMALA